MLMYIASLTHIYQVSEDEIVVSDCELQDISVVPLINALNVHKTFAVLDLSHNLLGNGTMEKLKRVFTSSGQNYGGLTLDLHCNRLGSTALFQICECPVLFSRSEVLNVSSNRLTDACASYLSTILQNCKDRRTVSPHRFPLLRTASLASRPTTPKSSRPTTPNKSRPTTPNHSNGRRYAEPRKSASMRLHVDSINIKDPEQHPSKSKRLLKSLLSRRKSKKDETLYTYIDEY